MSSPTSASSSTATGGGSGDSTKVAGKKRPRPDPQARDPVSAAVRESKREEQPGTTATAAARAARLASEDSHDDGRQRSTTTLFVAGYAGYTSSAQRSRTAELRTLSEAALIRLFQRHGTVVRHEESFHRTGPKKGAPRHFCFLEMATAQQALAAQRALNGHPVPGLSRRHLTVRFAHENAAQGPYDASNPLNNHGKRPRNGGAAADTAAETTSATTSTATTTTTRLENMVGSGEPPRPRDVGSQLDLLKQKLQELQNTSL